MSTAGRVVPGAPPPAPLSKSQQKKRRRAAAAQSKAPSEDAESVTIPDSISAALVDKAPGKEDIKSGAVASGLIADSQADTTVDVDDLKLSPIINLISKRLKVTNKKITRVTTYASIDPINLDDDQKALLQTLPSLEAVQKELREVKKAVEVREAELNQNLAAVKSQTAKEQAAKVTAAVRKSQVTSKKRTLDIINLLRLFNSLPQGSAGVRLNEKEVTAAGAVSRALFGGHSDTQQTVIDGLHSGAGHIEGIAFSRLLDLADQFSKQTPEVQKTNGDHPRDHVAVPEALTTAPSTGAISFMQADELDAPEPEKALVVEALATEPSAATNGLASVQTYPSEEAPTTMDPISSWADDEGGLPSLSGLQESFKASESATPVDVESPDPVEAGTAIEGDDGFTQARGRGGRGGRRRGRGGYRGGDRGGGHRNHGGRGGHRGGHRRAEGSGDGEYRGRGRGRGGPPRGQPQPPA